MATEEQRQRWAAEGRPMPQDRLKAKKPPTHTVAVYLEPDLVDQYNEQLIALEGAKLEEADAAIIAGLEEQVAAARAALAETTVELTFTSLGRRRYEEVVDSCPPTEEQNAKHKEEMGTPAPYNEDTFPPLLVWACLEKTEAGMFTLEDVQDWFEQWNDAELLEIFLAAMEVNTQRRVAGLGNG